MAARFGRLAGRCDTRFERPTGRRARVSGDRAESVRRPVPGEVSDHGGAVGTAAALAGRLFRNGLNDRISPRIGSTACSSHAKVRGKEYDR